MAEEKKKKTVSTAESVKSPGSWFIWVIVAIVVIVIAASYSSGFSFDSIGSNNAGSGSGNTPASSSQTNPATAITGTGGVTTGTVNKAIIAMPWSMGTTNNYTLSPTVEIAVPVVPNTWSDKVTVHGPTDLAIENVAYVRINHCPRLVYKRIDVIVPNCPPRLVYYHIQDHGRCVPVADLPWRDMAEVEFKALRGPTTVIVKKQRSF